ncbi:MAG: energy transducer TonB [Desulfovibrio sp. MES5]|uniref:energy transducer TonB n=1 Tax=Desulfovibrio sp. MES5 TaxID=1899016 RepID=UPI000B9D2757|nr:energy transducer TonB [Desulfovibrio sp. MES5]OXS28212.1 MAG: energy transducer TonB [Desulfovibrio sp. MES5]
MTTATHSIRSITLAFSLGMHALLLGGLGLLAREAPNNAERVYRVALAEFAPTADTPLPAPVTPVAPITPVAAERPAPPTPEPAPQKPDVQPAKPAQPKPETKKISPKKSDKAVPKEPVAPAQPPISTAQSTPAAPAMPTTTAIPTGPTGPAGPQPRTVGGLNAYECDSLDQRPSITRRAEPEYPPKARRMNIQGSARVRLVVDSSGQPCNCEVVSASPVGYFEEAALKAAKNMRFAPGKLKGQPVNTLVELPFIFRLR